MKKIILPALFGVLLLASCKKDYTCECTSTETTTTTATMAGETLLNETETDVTTTKNTVKDVTKKQMQREEECVSSETSYTYSESDAGVTIKSDTKIVNDCSLKK